MGEATARVVRIDADEIGVVLRLDCSDEDGAFRGWFWLHLEGESLVQFVRLVDAERNRSSQYALTYE